MKRVHLIAIGGAIMHNLAIALHRAGYRVTGSDDAIYNPAKINLERDGLLPATMGWDATVITQDLDVVIVGMHARGDNPELARARELGLRIMSFPEFVASHCQDKKRVVVAGSHGKTTTTAMIMHVLSKLSLDFDYLVGSSIDGFDLSV
ncbi:MAG TPA: peptidoglycan synthetase, partial [Bacteroidetes bacterium]|nr:peptidoglycan synthetase [Bacteroidota bacterium]